MKERRPALRAISLLVGLLALAAAGSAQPGMQQPVPPIIADVKEVLVPVIVTDPKGHHVGNLKRSDFKVSEDGVPQEIVSFRTTVDAPASETVPAACQAAGEP